MNYAFRIHIPEEVSPEQVKKDVSEMMITLSNYVQENGLDKKVGIKSEHDIKIIGEKI